MLTIPGEQDKCAHVEKSQTKTTSSTTDPRANESKYPRMQTMPGPKGKSSNKTTEEEKSPRE